MRKFQYIKLYMDNLFKFYHFRNILRLFQVLVLLLENDNFDFSSSFKIKLNKNDYYTIKDFEDGNYLAIDKLGVVYFLIHDPYKLSPLGYDLQDLNQGINNQSIDLMDLYDKQLG